MPKLRRVLEQALGGEPALRSLPHAGGFAPWPGVEREVTRWCRLADRLAVGIRRRDGAPRGLALWPHERES